MQLFSHNKQQKHTIPHLQRACLRRPCKLNNHTVNIDIQLWYKPYLRSRDGFVTTLHNQQVLGNMNNHSLISRNPFSHVLASSKHSQLNECQVKSEIRIYLFFLQQLLSFKFFLDAGMQCECRKSGCCEWTRGRVLRLLFSFHVRNCQFVGGRGGWFVCVT